MGKYILPTYILQEFKITDARDGSSRIIRHFQLLSWPTEQQIKENPNKISIILDFIDLIQKTREQFGIWGYPVILQSENGSYRVGIIAILMFIIERIRFEKIVDISEAVRLLGGNRQNLISSFDEYQFLYKVVAYFLKEQQLNHQNTITINQNNNNSNLISYSNYDSSNSNKNQSGDSSLHPITNSTLLCNSNNSQNNPNNYNQFSISSNKTDLASTNLSSKDYDEVKTIKNNLIDSRQNKGNNSHDSMYSNTYDLRADYERY